VTKPETLDKRYVGKLTKQALSLMNNLLRMDPRERFTAKEAISH
jgi:cyclin-dependent kinase-like